MSFRCVKCPVDAVCFACVDKAMSEAREEIARLRTGAEVEHAEASGLRGDLIRGLSGAETLRRDRARIHEHAKRCGAAYGMWRDAPAADAKDGGS